MDEDRASLGEERSADELREEIDRLAAENARLGSRLRARAAIRTFVTGALVVVTSMMLVASTVAVWGNRTVFDTDRFMSVIDPALDEPAFYDSLARNISDQVIDVLDLETRVRDRLTQLDRFLAESLVEAIDARDSVVAALSLIDRPTLADLTPAIVDPLETRVRGGITDFITSEEFQQRLPMLVRRAHEATLALIDEDFAEFPNVYLADGEVRLNLIPIIVEALEPVLGTLTGILPDISLPAVVSAPVAEARQELAESLAVRLPDDFGQLTVMSDDALSSLQSAAQKINRATWLLVIVTAALLAVTVAVAARRRRTVIWLSIGVTVALAVAWWTVARIRNAVIDQIVQPDSRAAVRSLVRETTDSLRTYVVVVLVLSIAAGLAAFVGAHLDEIARAVRWARAQAGDAPTSVNTWVTAHYDALRAVGFAVAAVAVLVIGIEIVPVVVIGALLGLFLSALAALRLDPSVAATPLPEA